MDAEIESMVDEMANRLSMIFMFSNNVNIVNQQQHRGRYRILPITRQLTCSDKFGSTNNTNITIEISQSALSGCIE
ncbi:MAG: Uncharacterised protein [Candidatus Poseidoniaceae archaeon]|nr:MAG: Uncharacterised protein [Candidatus Poseidoniaceae archaeon]